VAGIYFSSHCWSLCCFEHRFINIECEDLDGVKGTPRFDDLYRARRLEVASKENVDTVMDGSYIRYNKAHLTSDLLVLLLVPTLLLVIVLLVT